MITKIIGGNVNLKESAFGASLMRYEEEIMARAQVELKDTMNKIKKSAQSKLSANKSVRTGALKKSITAKIQRKRVKVGNIPYTRIWAGVGIDSKYKKEERLPNGKTKIHRPVKYAHFPEAGFTHYPDAEKVEAKPFLGPAVNENGGKEGIKKKLLEISRSVIYGQ